MQKTQQRFVCGGLTIVFGEVFSREVNYSRQKPDPEGASNSNKDVKPCRILDVFNQEVKDQLNLYGDAFSGTLINDNELNAEKLMGAQLLYEQNVVEDHVAVWQRQNPVTIQPVMGRAKNPNFGPYQALDCLFAYTIAANNTWLCDIALRFKEETLRDGSTLKRCRLQSRNINLGSLEPPYDTSMREFAPLFHLLTGKADKAMVDNAINLIGTMLKDVHGKKNKARPAPVGLGTGISELLTEHLHNLGNLEGQHTSSTGGHNTAASGSKRMGQEGGQGGGSSRKKQKPGTRATSGSGSGVGSASATSKSKKKESSRT